MMMPPGVDKYVTDAMYSGSAAPAPCILWISALPIAAAACPPPVRLSAVRPGGKIWIIAKMPTRNTTITVSVSINVEPFRLLVRFI